jgi:predicted lysophospholipase L1 biosynthesis ABC-type transport system permease subunit
MPVPVVASPGVARAAGADGTVPLHVGNTTVPGTIVATATSFPSVDGDFAVADLRTWVAAANAADPGTAVPGELWVETPSASAAQRLTRPPFSALDVSSQRATEAALRSDPLARGSLALLLATGVVAVLLSVVGLLLAVAGDVRDESGELFDLETQGASPREVQRHLLFRAAVVGVLGVLGGIAAGAVLGALVVAVVTVTAGAESALPPLELVLDWNVAAAGIVVLVLAAAAGAVAIARGAYDRVARTRFSEAVE